ncbi:MAG: hypothetical protein WCD89_14165 [Anaerocolumna sp.]
MKKLKMKQVNETVRTKEHVAARIKKSMIKNSSEERVSWHKSIGFQVFLYFMIPVFLIILIFHTEINLDKAVSQ